MDTPGLNSTFWGTVVGAVTLAGATIGAVWRIVAAPLRRITIVEQHATATDSRFKNVEEDLKTNSDAIANLHADHKRLHEDHGKLREILAAQPTRDDLARSEARMLERTVASEKNITAQITLVADMVRGHRTAR